MCISGFGLSILPKLIKKGRKFSNLCIQQRKRLPPSHDTVYLS
jgi:hypothetical protein